MLAFTFEDIEARKRADPDLQQLHVGPVFDGAAPPADDVNMFRSTLVTDNTRRVFDWWLGLAASHIPPLKSQLKIRDMAPFIECVALIDSDLDDDARVRLAGQGVEDMIGRSIGGCLVSDLFSWSPGLRKVFQQTIYGRNCVRYSVRDLRKMGKEYRTVGLLELPVIEDRSGKPLDFVYFEALSQASLH